MTMQKKAFSHSIMKNDRSFVLFSFAIMIVLINGCYSSKPVKVELLNELQGCEEDNVHFTVFRVYDDEFKKYENEIIFPLLLKSIKSDSLNNIFFPFLTERRLKITVEGFFSKYGRRHSSYGCIGAHELEIIKVIEIKDVTEEFDYPIRN